jgi:LPXTG-site transpeptidase (sortase) family protein
MRRSIPWRRHLGNLAVASGLALLIFGVFLAMAPLLPAPAPVPEPAAPSPAASAEVTATPRETATTPAASATPTPTTWKALLPTRLEIPKLKVDAQVVEVYVRNGEWDVSRIINEVGHLSGTGNGGEAGNAVFAAHVTLKGRGDGPFRWLETLQPGDQVIVYRGDRRYAYAVSEMVVVAPSAVEVLGPTKDDTLTLISCVNWDLFKGEYKDRLVVTAKRVP